MSKKPPELDKSWLGPLVLINVFIWLIFITPEANAVFCNATTNCLVEWVGALSGWAAAFAALLTVYVMRQQFHKQQQQIDNQQKQIDFQIGDARPIVYALTSLEKIQSRNKAAPFFNKVVVHIHNFNLRPLAIHRIYCNDSFTLEITHINLENDVLRKAEYFFKNGLIDTTIRGRYKDGEPSRAEIHMLIGKKHEEKQINQDLDEVPELKSYNVSYQLEVEQIDAESQHYKIPFKSLGLFY